MREFLLGGAWSRRTSVGVAAFGLAGALMGVSAVPAGAHATVLLDGKNAVAGERGVVTMRIPHGCNGNLATNRIKTRFGKQWNVKAKSVSGWTAKKRVNKKGRTKIIWNATGEPLAPDAVKDFKLKVRYPKQAGLYSTPTVQVCGDVKSKWTEPDRGGADGHHAYPVDYPVPRIKVRAG